MKQFLASVTVNGNEVQFIKEGRQYFIHWGEKDKVKSVQELRTPSGRKPSQKSAYKKFIEACDAAQYLKFDRL